MKQVEHPMGSPPSRAAWIEIMLPRPVRRRRRGSPPSRAAWIEMAFLPLLSLSVTVAAFTGGVD